MPHPVTQFQILSKTPDAAARFYSDLFGWTINADNPLGYRQIDTGSAEGIHGGIWPAPPQAADFVQLFVEVDDVAAAVSKAAALGARPLVPPTVLPGGDEMAVLHDPQGLSFGVWKSGNVT
ncbi:MAG TPA: VOC family protein [Bryobacteraceae bacterium]|jgi:hypothetical protein